MVEERRFTRRTLARWSSWWSRPLAANPMLGDSASSAASCSVSSPAGVSLIRSSRTRPSRSIWGRVGDFSDQVTPVVVVYRGAQYRRHWDPLLRDVEPVERAAGEHFFPIFAVVFDVRRRLVGDGDKHCDDAAGVDVEDFAGRPGLNPGVSSVGVVAAFARSASSLARSDSRARCS